MKQTVKCPSIGTNNDAFALIKTDHVDYKENIILNLSYNCERYWLLAAPDETISAH